MMAKLAKMFARTPVPTTSTAAQMDQLRLVKRPAVLRDIIRLESTGAKRISKIPSDVENKARAMIGDEEVPSPHDVQLTDAFDALVAIDRALVILGRREQEE